MSSRLRTRGSIAILTVLGAYFFVVVRMASAQIWSGSNNKGTAAVDRATGLALQGDAASAVKALTETNAASFTGNDLDFRACMLNRFGAADQPPAEVTVADPWVATLTKNYLEYWQRA